MILLTRFRFFYFLCLLVVASSCAKPFVKPDVTAAEYVPAGTTTNLVDFSVSEEPLPLKERFAKRLEKDNIQLYALKVANYSADTVWIQSHDLSLVAEGEVLEVVPQRKLLRTLRQSVFIHSLWFLVGPMVQEEGETGYRVEYHPIGAAFAAWGIRNGIVAYMANQEVKEMLTLTIPPGESPIAPSQVRYLIYPFRTTNSLQTTPQLRYTPSSRLDTGAALEASPGN